MLGMLTFASGNTCATSDAVAPGQEREPQHGVAEAEHHAQHVQDADHLGGRRADQHGAHHEAQHREQLQRDTDGAFHHCRGNA